MGEAVRLDWRLELFFQVVIFLGISLFVVDLELENTPPWVSWCEIGVVSIFTLEFFLRLYVAKNRWRYLTSFMGLIDLLAILPFYLPFFIDLRSLRIFSLLRLTRVLKLQRLNASIVQFLICFGKIKNELKIIGTILFLFLLVSSTMVYQFERQAQPEVFSDIWSSIWWSVITITTVGYGDMYPVTPAGRFIASIMVVFGLAVFGTFTSVVGTAFLTTIQRNTVEITMASREKVDKLSAIIGLDEQGVVEEALGYLEIIYDVQRLGGEIPHSEIDTLDPVVHRKF
ncbi:Voltage-gated potassium channel [Planctomycetales bacterium 10988]|nr:Voltage-gated potassium channel [Planctomycetales bacterium 10988]